jgi:hypothetical protein
MPTTPNPEANMPEKPASPRQLNYLKALAGRTGQTFTWPNTSRQASTEIARLKCAHPSTPIERAIEQNDDRPSREAAEDSVAIHGFEVVGYGSTATWSQRS